MGNEQCEDETDERHATPSFLRLHRLSLLLQRLFHGAFPTFFACFFTGDGFAFCTDACGNGGNTHPAACCRCWSACSSCCTKLSESAIFWPGNAICARRV